jgi:hypothetical protein
MKQSFAVWALGLPQVTARQVMIETKTTAKQGYDILLQRATFPLETATSCNNAMLVLVTSLGGSTDNPFIRPPAICQ